MMRRGVRLVLWKRRIFRVDVIFASRVDGVGGIEDVDLEEEGRRGVYEEL